MDYRAIQKIAKGVVSTSSACDGQLVTGKVISAKPLQIQLGEESGSIVLDGDDIILTQAVVSKKLYIKKHTHDESEELADVASATAKTGGPVSFVSADIPPVISEGITLKHKHDIKTKTLNAWVTEYGSKLPVKPENYQGDEEQIVITINRSLEVGDRVIMSMVSHGQQFVVLSRYFEVDNPGKDDDEG